MAILNILFVIFKKKIYIKIGSFYLQHDEDNSVDNIFEQEHIQKHECRIAFNYIHLNYINNIKIF